MTVLWWLVVPLVVTALAAVVISRASRPRPPADPQDSITEYERFRRAMERPVPAPRPARPSRGQARPAAPGEQPPLDAQADGSGRAPGRDATAA